MLDDLCKSQQNGIVKFVYSDFHITVEKGEYLLLRPADYSDYQICALYSAKSDRTAELLSRGAC